MASKIVRIPVRYNLRIVRVRKERVTFTVHEHVGHVLSERRREVKKKKNTTIIDYRRRNTRENNTIATTVGPRTGRPIRY